MRILTATAALLLSSLASAAAKEYEYCLKEKAPVTSSEDCAKPCKWGADPEKRGAMACIRKDLFEARRLASKKAAAHHRGRETLVSITNDIVSGTTTGKPTFDRPDESFDGSSSGNGLIEYDAFTFTVPATQACQITLLAEGMDTFLYIYAGVFDPNSPSDNGLYANDDDGPDANSAIGGSFNAGTTYTVVATGYGSDIGAYSVRFDGFDCTPTITTSNTVTTDEATYAAVITGNTATAPRWDRPNTAFTGISTTGVGYTATSFTVPSAQECQIDMVNDAGLDVFLYIYENSFDPSQPLVNGLAGDDDSSDLGTSGLNSMLVLTFQPGTTYYAVGSSFDLDGDGPYAMLFTGADCDPTITGSTGSVVGSTPAPTAAPTAAPTPAPTPAPTTVGATPAPTPDPTAAPTVPVGCFKDCRQGAITAATAARKACRGITPRSARRACRFRALAQYYYSMATCTLYGDRSC